MKSYHKRTVRRVLVSMAAGAILGGTGIGHIAHANADPVGCESIRWGFLGSQYRTICDSPRRADGSWERERRIWTPAGYVPRSTYCGTYPCSSSGGYYRQESTQGYERYVVFDHNVVQGEPGHLDGTWVLR